MDRNGFRYTISGESNPYWVLAEPILLRMWADSITKTSAIRLQMVNGAAVIMHIILFSIRVLARLAAIYELLGYTILVPSIVFVLGGKLFSFIGELVLYLLFAVTNMVPLRVIAAGLRNETYWAQSIAKTSFMGIYLAQSVAAFPNEAQAEYDRVIELYRKSNTPDGREQLEILADEWSKKLGEQRGAPMPPQRASYDFRL